VRRIVHHLKIKPDYYEQVVRGVKTFEIRKNDRNYQVDDLISLNEYNPEIKEYTGRSVMRKITIVFDDCEYVKADYVVLGIAESVFPI
jgi:hypothetical protein